MDFLARYKTYIAGVGLFGLALYQASQGQFEAAAAAFLGGLTAIGIRHETAPSAANREAAARARERSID